MNNTQQKQDIVNMYLSGSTYVEIGQHYGFTKQRAQQIVLKFLGPEVVKRERHKRLTLAAINKENSISPEKQELIALKRLVRAGKRWSIKSESCLGCNTTERKHLSSGYCQRCAFHFIPSFRATRINGTKKWLKNNPERVKINNKRSMDTYMSKIKSDPERLKRHKEKQYAYKVKKYGGEEQMKEYYREKAKNYYKAKSQKLKELLTIEEQVKLLNPDYRLPELEDYRKKRHDKYLKGREKQLANNKINYLKRKHAKANISL